LKLQADLRRLPPFTRILVQYVPHAFGWKAMNVPFILWLLAHRRTPIWVMFHEVAYPWGTKHSVKQNLLGAVTRIMAFLIAHAVERIYVAIPAWEKILRPMAPRGCPFHWLPIPSNLPTEVHGREIPAVRSRIASGPHSIVLGHFGTYGESITSLLAEVFPPLLTAESCRVGLLMGRGGEHFKKKLIRDHPTLSNRVYAPGELSPEQASAHLAACDALIQPYPDGVSSRRTSLMAGLALGLPIVTTEGPLTESIWQDSQAVVLAPAFSSSAFIEGVEALLADACRRTDLRNRSAAVYADRFSIRQTVKSLQEVKQALRQGCTPQIPSGPPFWPFHVTRDGHTLLAVTPYQQRTAIPATPRFSKM
jgi:glycosyltransferase involved in cell wall biosynthesis